MVLAFPIKQHSFPNTVKQTILLLLFPLVLAMQCKKSNKSPSSGTSAPIDLDVTVLASGLNHPWEILWGPDNFIWMTEREGKISRVNPANGTVELLLVIPDVIAQGEGGLLGMVLHPSFSVTPHVFVVYNFNSGSGYREKVVRYTYDGSTLVNPVTILSAINASTIHNGTVNRYNTKVRSFPMNIFAGMFGFRPREGFKADEGSQSSPKVDFNTK